MSNSIKTHNVMDNYIAIISGIFSCVVIDTSWDHPERKWCIMWHHFSSDVLTILSWHKGDVILDYVKVHQTCCSLCTLCEKKQGVPSVIDISGSLWHKQDHTWYSIILSFVMVFQLPLHSILDTTRLQLSLLYCRESMRNILSPDAV